MKIILDNSQVICYTLLMIEKIQNKEYEPHFPYSTDRRELYRQVVRSLEYKFKKDLLAEFDVEDNPKADRCFEIAWDMSHADGYRAVYNTFEEIVDLIK